MKFIRLFFIAVSTVLAFGSCQKELNFDNGGTSFGTLKSATSGDCLPSSINGIYKKDSVLTIDNFIDVQVDVSIPGTFDIRSDTINGCSFSKTGNVGFGLNTIRLYGSGKPVAAGPFTFTVKYDSSICKVNVVVLTSSGVTVAVYAMGGSPGNCTGVTLGGSYTQLVPMTASNTAQMNVTVTGTGTYSIKTDTVNGVHFDASGSFNSTTPSPQLVAIKATGIPLAAGPFNYHVTAVGISPVSQCIFSVSYIAPLSPAVFTLDGAPGACVPPTINGTYTAGTVLTSTNNIVINVTVTTAGTYSFSTDLQNGMKFTTAGVFTGIGPSTVTLLPVPGSTPVSGGITTTITPQVTTPACTIDIPVGAALDRIYKFNVGATVYTGPCSGMLLGMAPDLMNITGGLGVNSFTLALNNATGLITTGNYSGTSLAGLYASFQYFEGFPPTVSFAGDPNIPFPLNTNLTATISSLDMVNRVVQGTFSGIVRDLNTGNPVTVTNGTFKADF